jgi:hypothetical protein
MWGRPAHAGNLGDIPQAHREEIPIRESKAKTAATVENSLCSDSSTVVALLLIAA